MSASSGPDAGADLVLTGPDGRHIIIQVKHTSLASVDGLDRRLTNWNHGGSTSPAVRVLVADRVTAAARTILRDAGWGWLDLRGHLHLTGPGLLIDSDVPPANAARGRSIPLAGHVGMEVAATVLLKPAEPAAIRRIAAALGRAPSSVSAALSRMQASGLINEHRIPQVPELFWELAARWRPAHADVRSVPTAGDGAITDALKLGLQNVENTVGWALTDSLAAAAYGAPISVRTAHPPDFYVPDQATLRRAQQLLGTAPDHHSRGATIRIAPVPVICSGRVDPTGWTTARWPLAQPLFVALDLAQDPGRGREVLDGWTPAQWGQRVW